MTTSPWLVLKVALRGEDTSFLTWSCGAGPFHPSTPRQACHADAPHGGRRTWRYRESMREHPLRLVLVLLALAAGVVVARNLTADLGGVYDPAGDAR